MKLSATVGFAILIGPIALAAQNGAQPTVLTFSPPVAGCPVSLRAQHKADGGMVQVSNGHPRGTGQWLHLVLGDTGSNSIVKATVTVHGYSNKARITQAGTEDGADAARTATVTLSALQDHTVAGDVWAPGMTAVTQIDLDAVTYADGSMASFTGRQACRVAPDPFMLVAVR